MLEHLSSKDPKYHPSLYHDGAVWPLVTGWCAEAKLNMVEKNKRFITFNLWQNEYYLKTVCMQKLIEVIDPNHLTRAYFKHGLLRMYIYAIRQMMLGMNLNMIENRIYFDPQIPDSLRNNALPINFEHSIQTIGGIKRFNVVVDPSSEKIFFDCKHGDMKIEPEIVSNSTYSINIS